MPIKSYIAYPAQGQKKRLERALSALPECEVLPAASHDLLVLVTDTPNEDAEKQLAARLQAVIELQCLALVSGYQDPADEDEANTTPMATIPLARSVRRET
ncbi:MAG: hypothetical protein KJZ86_10360 [Caldilineaceae bacterium]|nr:hypothetical protein [Caldilineaceae bacterium]